MGIKCRATLRVEFEMEDGQPETLAQTVLTREVNNFRLAIEHGTGIAKTGVKLGSARVDIVTQNQKPA